jgi:hypothetical protein
VLETYAPVVPGFFLYFPSRAQRSPALRLFVDAAKELALRATKAPAPWSSGTGRWFGGLEALGHVPSRA